MKVVIVVTKGNVVLSVWAIASSDKNQIAIERAVAMAVQAGAEVWQARRNLTEDGFTEVGEYRITVAERRVSMTNEIPKLEG